MKLEDLNSQIGQYDRDETDSANRETAADQACSDAKAAADAAYQNDIAVAATKRNQAYREADQLRKQLRDAERAANAERTTELKAAFQDGYQYLNDQDAYQQQVWRDMAPVVEALNKGRARLNEPPDQPGDLKVKFDTVDDEAQT